MFNADPEVGKGISTSIISAYAIKEQGQQAIFLRFYALLYYFNVCCAYRQTGFVFVSDVRKDEE